MSSYAKVSQATLCDIANVRLDWKLNGASGHRKEVFERVLVNLARYEWRGLPPFGRQRLIAKS
jgi:hypothetical protein